MRISDGSSDVCSSDLPQADGRRQRKETETPQQAVEVRHVGVAEKAIAETCDHVEERIEVARLEPDRRQGVHRVEHTGQKDSGVMKKLVNVAMWSNFSATMPAIMPSTARLPAESRNI